MTNFSSACLKGVCSFEADVDWSLISFLFCIFIIHTLHNMRNKFPLSLWKINNMRNSNIVNFTVFDNMLMMMIIVVGDYHEHTIFGTICYILRLRDILDEYYLKLDNFKAYTNVNDSFAKIAQWLKLNAKYI